jgi:hypothetical protein
MVSLMMGDVFEVLTDFNKLQCDEPSIAWIVLDGQTIFIDPKIKIVTCHEYSASSNVCIQKRQLIAWINL